MTTQKNHKSKILVVSDDDSLSGPLAVEFLRRGYLLCAVKPDVLQTVFDEVPHLIIVDENYGGEEGKKIAAAIKNDTVVKYIPVLFLEAGGPDVRIGKTADLCLRRTEKTEKIVRAVEEALAKNYNELDLNPLTHLPGVHSSVSRIEHAVQSGKAFAVCCIDLSNLNAFNAVYGVGRGDEVIVRLAGIAASALKKEGTPDDFLGHLGGDDLILVTRPGRAVPISETVIRNFNAAIGAYYDLEDRRKGGISWKNAEGVLTRYPLMGVSIAIVPCGSRGPAGMAEVSRIAGEVKKIMKERKESCYVKYPRFSKGRPGRKSAPSIEVCFPSKKSIRVMGPSVEALATGRRPLPIRPAGDGTPAADFGNGGVREERPAAVVIRERRVRTLYQPILDLNARAIIGYEALTRAVPEGLFPDVTRLFSEARDCGLVKDLDKLCIETALTGAQALAPGRKLFMNLNHETLIDEEFMKGIFLKRGSLDPRDIVIEVTEQSILRSFDRVREALAELRAQGMSVAIDDVGGGAVSLRDVAVLRPDYMKFDRSLIRQIDSNITKQQIVLSLKIFAGGIQAVTTAEGIETKEEYEAVLACGITLGQGYYFAKPGPAFPELIQ